MKKVVIAVAVAVTMLIMHSCQSSCNCGYAQTGSQSTQIETNL